MDQAHYLSLEQLVHSPLALLFDCWQQFFQASRHMDTLTPEVLEVVVRATGASRAILMLMDDDEERLVVKAIWPPSETEIQATHMRTFENIAGWVAQHGQALLIPGIEAMPLAIQEAINQEQRRTTLCVPLQVNGEMLGVLHLTRPDSAPVFAVEDLWFTTLVASGIATTLHTSRLQQQIERDRDVNAQILASIPSSMLILDRSMRIISANRNFLEKARRSERSTLGRPIGAVFPQVLIDSTRLRQGVEEVFRTGQPRDGGKMTYRTPGTTPRIYYYRLTPLKAKDKATVEHVMLLLDDITERERLGEEVRKAERHLASVVECASDLVISLKPDGQIVTWNQAAEIISGFSVEQIQGRTLVALCAPKQQSVMDEMLHNLAAGSMFQSAEVDMLTADNHYVPIAWICSPMCDDSGDLTGVVAVGRDLTERRRLEAQLLHSSKMASLGVMASGIAHEVRNPLGIISANAQLILDTPDDPNLRNECANKIYAATRRASRLIEDVLRFARPQNKPHREMDLHALLDETFLLLKPQWLLWQVTLCKRFEAEVPLISCNPESLQQVFINLTLNAADAMDQGGTLTVTTRSLPPRMVEIQFTDTGHGIPAADLLRVFDPFFTTRPVGRGTGLGLSISYSIIEQHQGSIEVESEVGRGTTFTIRLPTLADEI